MDQKDNQQNPQPVNNFYGNINHYNVYHGPVSYNAPINNYNVEKEEEEEALDNNEEPPEDWEMKELKFFSMKDFDTVEKQQALAAVLRSMAEKIDRSNGREWFGHYAAYRYAKKQIGVIGKYVDFFCDIEAMIPDMLIIEDPEAKGDVRYKNYTKALGREVKDWYVDRAKLPPINCLLYQSYRFGCRENSFNKQRDIIKELFRWFDENVKKN